MNKKTMIMTIILGIVLNILIAIVCIGIFLTDHISMIPAISLAIGNIIVYYLLLKCSSFYSP